MSWIGNSVIFSCKFLNALATAVVFVLIFGTLAYFRLATLSITFQGREPAPIAKPALRRLLLRRQTRSQQCRRNSCARAARRVNERGCSLPLWLG